MRNKNFRRTGLNDTPDAYPYPISDTPERPKAKKPRRGSIEQGYELLGDACEPGTKPRARKRDYGFYEE